MADSLNPFDFSDFQSPANGGRHDSPQATSADYATPYSENSNGFDPFAGPNPNALSGDSWEAPTTDGFGRNVVAASPLTDSVVSPPVLWCVLAGLAAAIGVVLGVLGMSSIGLAVAGWVASGPISIGLLAVHTTMDTKRKAAPFYSPPGWSSAVYWGVMVVAFAGVGISAWSIAQWAGRL